MKEGTEPAMKIVLTRASVCAGDDADAPHERVLHLPAGASLVDIVGAAAGPGYRASVQGDRATWSVFSRWPLAVVAQQWQRPRMLPASRFLATRDLDTRDGVLRLHFNYHAQLDPDVVYEVLSRLDAR